MKARNILITLLIILLISFAFFNSSSVNTIDDLAYVVAIGFDVGENYALKVSFQINMPSVSKSSSSSKSESSSIITTIDCNNFDAGVTLLDSYLNKNVNMSHCKLLIRLVLTKYLLIGLLLFCHLLLSILDCLLD